MGTSLKLDKGLKFQGAKQHTNSILGVETCNLQIVTPHPQGKVKYFKADSGNILVGGKECVKYLKSNSGNIPVVKERTKRT